ncbi:MAG: hypothetical protein JNM21_17240 [Taibaiella sp.]|nr:hypothetical protein [Taibaiella sp.]
MKRIYCLICLCVLAGCNTIQEKKTSALETVLEQATGIDADIDNLKNTGSNKAEIDISDDGLNLNERFNNGFATITAAKEVISLTITREENGQDNILLGFTGPDLTQMRPIEGRMNKSGENSMSFATAKYEKNEADMMMAFEVEGEIISLKPEQTVIRLKGQLGYAADAQTPGKWKAFAGTITLNYPVFQALGSAKEDFIY